MASILPLSFKVVMSLKNIRMINQKDGLLFSIYIYPSKTHFPNSRPNFNNEVIRMLNERVD